MYKKNKNTKDTAS